MWTISNSLDEFSSYFHMIETHGFSFDENPYFYIQQPLEGKSDIPVNNLKYEIYFPRFFSLNISETFKVTSTNELFGILFTLCPDLSVYEPNERDIYLHSNNLGGLLDVADYLKEKISTNCKKETA